MSRTADLRMILKAASLYCHGENGVRLTKTEIANRLNTHPTQISRWLDEAFDRKIISLCYNPPRLEALEEELTARFNLKAGIVVPTAGNYEITRQLRAKAAASFFDQQTRNKRSVVVSGGNALYEMAVALPERERDIDLFPAAIIGRGPTITHIDPGVLVSVIWAKSGGRPPARSASRRTQAHFVTVPPLPQ